MGLPAFTSRWYSFSSVRASYSEWPIMKNCLPWRLRTMHTPASSDEARI